MATPLAPTERSRLLERTPALQAAHQAAASQGATAAPDAQDDVDLHYVCFVKAGGTLWELDGRRKGPLARGPLSDDDDVLSEKALLWGPVQFLQREGGDMRFSCVALAGSLE
jgi:ubiquitin carboxyl-terminal hydrolase L3